MRATIGDRIVIMSRHLDEPVREGEIAEVHGADGGPPYVVRWFDGDHTGILFPGPDARITHESTAEAEGSVPRDVPRSKRWNAGVFLDEHETGLTRAHVQLDTGVRMLQGYGEAHRRPDDLDVPQIGDEVAVGRAFLAIGNHLLRNAAMDIEDIEGHPVTVHASPTGSPL